MSNNLESGWGSLLKSALAVAGPTLGKVFVVCPAADTNYDKLSQIVKYDPDGVARLFTTVEAAYAAMTTSCDDVCFLAGAGTHALATAMTVSKNRCHFVGLDLGGHLEQQGAKIELTGAIDVGFLVKTTGVRNTFKNIKFIQSSTHANAIYCFVDAGEGTVVENCSAVFGVIDNLDLTTSSELVCNGDSSLYRFCAFGSSVLLTSAARAVCRIIRVTGSASGDATKNVRFEDCMFKIMSSSATANHVLIAATNALKFENVIKNCEFVAAINQTTGGVTLDDAISSVSGLVEGNLLVINPASNCTKVCAGVTDNVKVVGAAPSSTSGIGTTPA